MLAFIKNCIIVGVSVYALATYGQWRSDDWARNRAFASAHKLGLDVVGGGAVFRPRFGESITIAQVNICRNEAAKDAVPDMQCEEKAVLVMCDWNRCQVVHE